MFVSTDYSLPQNITVTSAKSASLEVHWEPPSDMESYTGYKIQYTKIGSNDKKSTKASKEAIMHTIPGLVACEKYSVCMATMKDHSTGKFSDAVEGVAGECCEL